MKTKQAPLHSGFGAQTTAREVIGRQRLDGAIAVVTGGYVGVGLETTRALSGAGATVIVPARTLDKARAALADVDRVEVDSLDLSDPRSIDAFAARFAASGRPVHILVNNAGIMAAPLTRDARGFESQLATNHLGHFQLTARLWPALRKASGARVVSLSSRGHVRSAVDFDDPHFERRPYDKWLAYGQSKTANVLFAVEATRRWHEDGITANAVHPGAIAATNLARHMDRQVLADLLASDSLKYKTPEQGAATSVLVATSPQLQGIGGRYFEDCNEAAVVDPSASDVGGSGVAAYALDLANAERLWELSKQLVA